MIIALMLLTCAAVADAQQYVQNGQILYEKVSTPYTYYYCGRAYTGYRWEYKQVLNYADKDWRQKALDIVDKAKERQSFEETLSYLGAKGLLSPANSGYAGFGGVPYPSANGNVLGGFASLEYSRYGTTNPLDPNKASELIAKSIDQFERSTAENARRGSEIHASTASLISQNADGARAIVEVQETRALVKETLQGMANRDLAFSQMLQSMKPQSSESFRYEAGQRESPPQVFKAPAQAEPLTGEEKALLTNRCAVCHGETAKGGFRFDGESTISEDLAGAVSLRVDAKAPKHRSEKDKNGNPVPYAMPPVGSDVAQLTDQERDLIRSAARKLVAPGQFQKQ